MFNKVDNLQLIAGGLALISGYLIYENYFGDKAKAIEDLKKSIAAGTIAATAIGTGLGGSKVIA